MRNGQVLFAFVLALLNTVYASQLLQMDRPFANGEPGPAFLPALLCVFVYFAVARILVIEYRQPLQDAGPGQPSPVVPHMPIVGPVVAIGLTCVFIAGFFYFGYLLSAAVYTFLIAFFFNYEASGHWKRSVLTGVAIAASATVFGWLFFVELFGLYLPAWEA